LVTAFKHRRQVLVKGPPGGGKSDIVSQAVQEVQADFLIEHPAVADPTDYKGMPAVLANGTAEFLPFGDLNRLIQAQRPLVCFLDDIGQAAPAVQAALMQLLLARRVNGHKISDHIVFCGATNDTKHTAGVAGMLEPVKSRWHSIVELEVSVDDWCAWALANNMPPELIAFILNVPSDENRADSPFVLRSQRGQYYALTRNRPKPHLMFGVGLYGEGLKCLPGWFSDQSGELVSLG
jgi:hypothetical protein